MDEGIKRLCDVIRETSFSIHRYHRHGHSERIYENALAHRLHAQDIRVAQQHPVSVYDEDGFLLGDLVIDLLVDERLIVELKACKGLADEHVAQLLGYLRATRIRHGILVNFGAEKLEIRKYIL
ncbi:MAG: GxxExxY protein [Lentisphaerae bacterium]|nr:GxxExxY protein [Lentisphaerota bacterium]